MQSILARRTLARLFLIIGLLLMIVGYIFSRGKVSNISGFFMIISLLIILVGMVFTVLTLKFKKSSLYLFFAAFSLQLGIFVFLSRMEVVPVSFPRVWPLLSVFAGIAFIPAGWYRYGNVRFRYIVPALTFVVLGAILLLFSLGLISFSFVRFFKDWWPLLGMLCGIIFVLVSLGTQKTKETQN